MRRFRQSFKSKSETLKDDKKYFLTKNKNKNNSVPDGHDRAGQRPDPPWSRNTFNAREDLRQRGTPEELAAFLDVVLGACEDRSLDCDRCVQMYVSEQFPKPPEHLDQNLRRHLLDVQEAVLHGLVRLGPGLGPLGLVGRLSERFHRETFAHLHSLLQKVTSTKNSFVLMHWALHTYQSEELLGHPDLQEMDTIKKVDAALVNDWVEKGREKVLENLQKEVHGSLEKILQFAMGQERCDDEEAYVRLQVDTIQCIEAMISEGQKICSELSRQVQEVCFKELLTFVRSYTAEQREALQNKAKTDKPETIHFLQTLTTCRKLKQYVRTKDQGVEPPLVKDMVETLEKMETFALDLLMDIVAGFSESHLTRYFKSYSKLFPLFSLMEEHFPKLSYGVDEQKMVMDEAYELIARIYVKHLIQHKQRELKKHWHPDIGQTVAEDAELLHRTISLLAPGVQQCNIILLMVKDMLECQSIDSLKITVAFMQEQSLTKSKDMQSLTNLLRWKGLNRWEVDKVLDALPPDLRPPDDQETRSTSWYSCFTCC